MLFDESLHCCKFPFFCVGTVLYLYGQKSKTSLQNEIDLCSGLGAEVPRGEVAAIAGLDSPNDLLRHKGFVGIAELGVVIQFLSGKDVLKVEQKPGVPVVSLGRG